MPFPYDFDVFFIVTLALKHHIPTRELYTQNRVIFFPPKYFALKIVVQLVNFERFIQLLNTKIQPLAKQEWQ